MTSVTPPKPRRVLWVTDIRFDRAKGDLAQTIYRLRALASQGVHVDVVHPSGDPERLAFLEVCIEGVTYRQTSASKIIWAAEQMWKTGVYSTAFARGPQLASEMVRFVPRNRIIAYIYGGHFAAHRRFLEKAWKMCGKIIVQGEGQLDHVRKLGLSVENVVPIPCTIDVARFRENPPIVGFIGTLYAFQCLDIVISVVERVRHTLPYCRLLLVGSETSRPLSAYEKSLLARIRTTPWIDWIPLATNSALPIIYRAMDLMITLYDPDRDRARPFCGRLLKTKVLEAMASGVPVVANPSWGNTKLLGEEYGFFASSPEHAVELVQTLLCNRPLRNMVGEKLQKRAEAFDLPVIGGMYADLIQEKK